MSVLPSHSTFKPRLRILNYADEPVAALTRRWEDTYPQYKMLRAHCDYPACGSLNDSV